MNKEDIIYLIWVDIAQRGIPVTQEDVEGWVNVVLENVRPTLPQNLDEAADKYAEGHSLWLHTAMKECFKAGAEWTGSQGVVRETSMMEDDLGDLCPVISDMRYLGFKPGDEVIVSIIKKA